MWSRRRKVLVLFALLCGGGPALSSCNKDDNSSPPTSPGSIVVNGKRIFPPSFPRATPNPQGAVLLEWGDPNDGEDGYIVERRLPDTMSWVMVTTVPPDVTRATDTRTREKMTYFYRILTYSGGVTLPSSEVRVTVPDLLPPNTTLLFYPPPRTKDRTAVFFFQANEATREFRCTVDGESRSCNPNDPSVCLKDSPLCIASVVVSGLNPGRHSFSVAAVDLTGKVDPTPATYDWVVDDTPPSVTLNGPSSPTDYDAVAGVVTFTFTADKPSIFFCQRDKDSPFPCLSPTTVTYPREPSPLFTLIAEDEAGNRTTLTYSFRFDIEPPTLTLGSYPSVVKPNVSFTIPITATDDTGTPTVTCQLDDSPPAYCSPISSAVEGPHTVTITAVDSFGKKVSRTITFEVDGTPPAITFAETPDPTTAVSFLRYRFRVTNGDVVSHYYCRFSPPDTDFTECSDPYDRFRVPPGSYTLTVTATDRVGNVTTPITHTTTVNYPDFTTDPCRVPPPVLRIASLWDNGSFDPDPRLDRMLEPHTSMIGNKKNMIGFYLEITLAYSLPVTFIPLGSVDLDGIFGAEDLPNWSSSFTEAPQFSGCGSAIFTYNSGYFPTYTTILPGFPPDSMRFGYLAGAYKPQNPLQYLTHDILGFSPPDQPHLLLRLHHPEPDQFPFAGSSYVLRFLVDAQLFPAPTTFTLLISDVTQTPPEIWATHSFSWPLGGNHDTFVKDLLFSPPSCPFSPPFVEIQGYALGGYCEETDPRPRGCLDRIRLPIACP